MRPCAADSARAWEEEFRNACSGFRPHPTHQPNARTPGVDCPCAMRNEPAPHPAPHDPRDTPAPPPLPGDDLTPEDALRAWPGEHPLACLLSGPGNPVKSRWSLLAPPAQVIAAYGDPREILHAHLACRVNAQPPPPHAARLPFGPGWLVAISYEAGAALEGLVEPRSHAESGPAIAMARIGAGLVHDRLENRWHAFGDPSFPALSKDASIGDEGCRVTGVRSRVGQAAFERMVDRARAYIRDGDVYQVNLAHALEARLEGSPRALFRDMATHARPWHGAYLDLPPAPDGRPRAIASVSPELFLEFDPETRLVRARPMKGTRGIGHTASTASGPHAADSIDDLAQSAKDRAELAMIVDLMRNDIGRSCVLGSVRVAEPRAIEHHTDASGAGLLQATATVTGTLRPDRTPLDLLWSALPPGSVTGAPKIRAMQIIRELEPDARGFYCGVVGFIGDDGRMTLNVAIRTATVHGGRVVYPVGAGIVADSDPTSEWHETLAKAWPFMRVGDARAYGADVHPADPNPPTRSDG